MCVSGPVIRAGKPPAGGRSASPAEGVHRPRACSNPRHGFQSTRGVGVDQSERQPGYLCHTFWGCGFSAFGGDGNLPPLIFSDSSAFTSRSRRDRSFPAVLAGLVLFLLPSFRISFSTPVSALSVRFRIVCQNPGSPRYLPGNRHARERGCLFKDQGKSLDQDYTQGLNPRYARVGHHVPGTKQGSRRHHGTMSS